MLDSQLYPVLNKDSHSARQQASLVQHKVNTVLPEIRKAQQEIQLRMDTAEALLAKGFYLFLTSLNTSILLIANIKQFVLSIFILYEAHSYFFKTCRQ